MNIHYNPLAEEKKTAPPLDGKVKLATEKEEEEEANGVLLPLKRLAKWWPIGAVKIANWFLLLALAICSSMLHLFWEGRRNWMDCWYFLYGRHCSMQGWNGWTRFAAVAAILFTMATFSLIAHFWARKKATNAKMPLASLAIADLCCSLFIIGNLVPLFGDSLLRIIAQILKPVQIGNHNGSRCLPIENSWQTTEFMSKFVSTPQIVDPAVLLLSSISALLSAFLAHSIFAALKMKLANLLPPTNYRQFHPNCTQLDAFYAAFWPTGLLKTVHWIIPIGMFIASLYGNFHPDYSHKILTPVIFASIFCVFYANWLSYLQNVHFINEGDGQEGEGGGQSPPELPSTFLKRCKFDCLLHVAGIFAYLLAYTCFFEYRYGEHIIKYIIMVAICLLSCSIFLMFRHGMRGGTFQLQLPGVAINVTINGVDNANNGEIQ